ncbi:MAG TPA: ATP-dependent sacrificial sulfur transferase LarE [Nitrospiria bacterium]|jgi:uncharacterized protein
MSLNKDYSNLQKIIAEMGSVLVAYSGGIDSTLVLKVAHDTIGPKAGGATAISPSLARSEFEGAVSIAKSIGATHFWVKSKQLQNPSYTQNDKTRCYHCKHDLYENLSLFAKRNGFSHIVNGTHLDDLGDFRPGLRAAKELEIRSPLLEAQLNKAQVRDLSQWLSLPNWNKPADACLASRIPYGVTVTQGRLNQIEKAEDIIRGEGFKEFRVRYHGDMVRIEVSEGEMPRWENPLLRLQIVHGLKKLGFTYITLDLEGYRKGSLNEGKN